MKMCKLSLALAALLFAQRPAGAAQQTVVIESDDYAEGQILNTISPFVTLSTGAFSDYRPRSTCGP